MAFSQSAEDYAQKKSLHAAEQDRADVAEPRRVFIRRQPALDPDHLVFIDETWATTNMARRYGRARPERTREGLWQLIGQTLDRFLPQECRNFFKNAGYSI
jgi:hypothetical protein